MVVVNPKSTANLKPTTTPKPTTTNPLEDYIPHVYNPVENIVRDRNEDALISKNKEIIRAKYYQLTELLGNYDAIKKQFDMRGYYIPPESYFHPEILEAGGIMDAATSVAETVIGGIAEGIQSVFPRAVTAPPPTAELLDPQQQVTLIRTMNDVIAQVKAYFDFRAPKVTPTTQEPTPTPTPTPTVVIPQTVTIPQEFLRPSRPNRIRTRDLKTNLKPIDEVKYDTALDMSMEEPLGQDWNKPVRKFRDDYVKSQITEGDYFEYIPSSGSSSSSSGSSSSSRPDNLSIPKPILDLTSFALGIPKVGKPILDLTSFPPKGRLGTPIDLEHTKKPKYIEPTQKHKLVASQTLSVLKALLTDSRGLIRIKRTDEQRTKTQIWGLITKTWGDNGDLQKHILGLLNFYGVTIKSTGYRKGEVGVVVQQLMEMNPQILNTFMNELIKILENDPRNKLKFIFEPVATDSGTLAVEGADPIFTSVDFNDPVRIQNFINALKEVLNKTKINEEVAKRWYNTLVKELEKISFENYKKGEEYDKSRQNALQLLNDGIEAKLKQLLYNISNQTKYKFDIDKIKKLVKIFMDALREPASFSGLREVVSSPIFTRVVDEVKANNIDIDTPFTQVDFDAATEEFDEMFGSQSYDINTVIRTPFFEIEEIPNDEPPPPDEPPDENPVQLYRGRVKGFRWFTANPRVLALLITLISTFTGATIKIVKTIKDEHTKDKKEDTPEPTESKKPIDISKKEEPTPKKEEPEQPKPRPKRTKRHGDLP